MPIQIETPRLYIRELIPADAEGMFVMDSDKEVHKYLGNNPVTEVQQCADVIAFVQSQYEQYGIGRWAVIKKDTNEFIGWTGYKYFEGPLNKHTDFYDFGYRFASAHWRQGYATESGTAALRYGIDVLGFRKIYGMTAPDNIGSRKTLEKLGFHYVETFNYDAVPSLWANDPTTWYKLGETQPDI